MRLKKRSVIVFYFTHCKIILFLVLAFLTRPLRKIVFKANFNPVVILYGHLLDGNLKPIFEKGVPSSYTNFETYFLTIDKKVYDYNKKIYNSNILLATSFLDICKVFDSDCIVTSHGPTSLFLIHYLRPKLPFVDVWHGVAFIDYTPDLFTDMRFYKAHLTSSEYYKNMYVKYRGFDKDKIIATGMAKHDALYYSDKKKDQIVKELNLNSFSKIILFAPTWWGGSHGRIENEKPFGVETDKFIRDLNKVCKENNFITIFRMHQNSKFSFNSKTLSNIISLPQMDFPDTYGLLSCVDLLITDWSSIGPDFTALKKPIIYIDNVAPENFYKSGFDLPLKRGGVIIDNIELFYIEIVNLLTVNEYVIPKSQQILFNNVFGENYDGNSTERCVDFILSLIPHSRKKDLK